MKNFTKHINQIYKNLRAIRLLNKDVKEVTILANNGNVVSIVDKEITDSYTILEEDNGKLLWLNSEDPIIITLDLLVTDSFKCSFYSQGTGGVIFEDGTAVAGYPDGVKLLKDKTGTLSKKISEEVYKYKGEFSGLYNIFNVSTLTDNGCAAASGPVLDTVVYHDGIGAIPAFGDTVYTDAAGTIPHVSSASNEHVYLGDVAGGGFANGANWLYTDAGGIRLTINCK